ncbi:MAG TPA: hypothetical protein DCP69_03390 [Candidatus Omnitrophica bacterium]|nr:hypothetical protein [Candidatus Omnitrophota bacterium]
MAKELVKLKALGRIDYNGGVYIPGTEEDTFDCDPVEASRLKELGVAVDAVAAQVAPPPPPGPTAAALEAQKQKDLELQAQNDLLAKIAEAATREEIHDLLPESEPVDADFSARLTAAFQTRLAELEA